MGKTIIPDKERAEEPKKFQRFTIVGDQRVELQVREPSEEAVKALGLRTKRTIISDIAINPPWIEKVIAKEKAKLMRELAMMHPKNRMKYLRENRPIDFVEEKQEKGFRKYDITCVQCGDPIAYVWAKDDKLIDWCDLHYICSHDKNTWYGAMAVNVSPIDGSLGFECACGEDTRDYRANQTLPRVVKTLMMEYSDKHRGFGHPNAAFVALRSK